MLPSSFLGWLLIGLALRLLFLPLTVHADTIAVYYRMNEWRSGSFDLYSFGLQGLPLWLHGLWAELTGIPLPEFAAIHWPSASVPEVREVVQAELLRPGAAWHVALWKLPYALVDLVCAVVVGHLIGGERGRTLLKLWVLCPVFLFTAALFGKYESFMLLPLLLAFRDWKHGREERGFLWFGVAIAMRLYPIILLPPLVLMASGSLRRRVELSALAAIPLGLVLATTVLKSVPLVLLLAAALFGVWRVYLLLRGGRVELVLGLSVLVGISLFVPGILAHLADGSGAAGPVVGHAQQLAHGLIELAEGDAILLAYLAFGLACLWAHRAQKSRVRATPGARASFDDYLDAALIGALSLFALSSLNPQYFALYFALALLRLGRSTEAGAAFAVQLVGYFLYISFLQGGALSVRLFTPLSPRILNTLPDLVTLLPAGFDDPGPTAFGRTLFLLGSLWMAFEILRSRRAPEVSPGRSWALGASFVFWPVTLGLLAWLPFSGTFERPGTYKVADVKLDGGTPLDGALISTWGGIPVAVEIHRELGASQNRVTEGNRYVVVNDEIPDEGTFELVIPPEELKANDYGITRVPLGEPGFLPQRTYRLVWSEYQRNEGSFSVARPIYEVDGAAVLATVGDDFQKRYFDETRAGWVFLLLAGLAALGGAGLLLASRFSRSSP